MNKQLGIQSKIPCKVYTGDYANVRQEMIEKTCDPLFLLSSTPEIFVPKCMKCTLGERS